MSLSYIAVIGHATLLETEQGAATVLRQLGASVRMLDLWEEAMNLVQSGDDKGEVKPRALVFEARDRPDLAVAALRALRKESYFDGVGALVGVTVGQIARMEPSSGFDDFILHPYIPEELYARIRALEWRRSEFATEERHKVGGVVVDKAAHEVSLEGRLVAFTNKEFSLLVYLCEHRGKVLSREHLLSRVWGHRYDGGARTVDIHVRRLRAKLGPSFPLQTLRGSGYKLCEPNGSGAG